MDPNQENTPEPPPILPTLVGEVAPWGHSIYLPETVSVPLTDGEYNVDALTFVFRRHNCG